jgi:Mycothiol maleylpyruvate isomerase N-terminal domain
MADDRELAGLDPFALLDTEAGRLDAFLSGLGESGWTRPSRCAGWAVRDVAGHLAAAEDYHRACLDGTVARCGPRLVWHDREPNAEPVIMCRSGIVSRPVFSRPFGDMRGLQLDDDR